MGKKARPRASFSVQQPKTPSLSCGGLYKISYGEGGQE